LDVDNNGKTIQPAFDPYYRATILSGETDLHAIHDLKANLDGYQVYSRDQIEKLVALYLSGADHGQLDLILDPCVASYTEELDEDG
jgi:type I restriction enzyme R subunit